MVSRLAWRHVVVTTLLGVSMGGSAGAQELDPNRPNAPTAPGSLRPVLGIGLTAGGDRLTRARFTNGEVADVKAGQLLQLYGGLEYQIASQISAQATLGYHVQKVSGTDGHFRFSRFPVELLGHYSVTDQWRLGGGVRLVNDAKFSGGGVAAMPTVEFDNAVGKVIEAEYLTNRKLGIKLRYVSEKYKASPPFSGTLDGSHLGLMVNLYL